MQYKRRTAGDINAKAMPLLVIIDRLIPHAADFWRKHTLGRCSIRRVTSRTKVPAQKLCSNLTSASSLYRPVSWAALLGVGTSKLRNSIPAGKTHQLESTCHRVFRYPRSHAYTTRNNMDHRFPAFSVLAPLVPLTGMILRPSLLFFHAFKVFWCQKHLKCVTILCGQSSSFAPSSSLSPGRSRQTGARRNMIVHCERVGSVGTETTVRRCSSMDIQTNAVPLSTFATLSHPLAPRLAILTKDAPEQLHERSWRSASDMTGRSKVSL